MDDVDEFVAALKQHHEAMRALAVRTMHDQSLADDALQNAYTSAFTNRASFRGDAAFRLGCTASSTGRASMRYVGANQHNNSTTTLRPICGSRT